MSEITKEALARKFIHNGRNLVRRIKPIPVIPRAVRTCPACQKPLFIAPNQLVKSHRECRSYIKRRRKWHKK